MQEKLRRLLRLQDLDLMIEGCAEPARQALPTGDVGKLRQAREELARSIDAGLLDTYARVRRHHARAIVALHSGVCLGCFMRCPTAVVPRAAVALKTCQRCGRILVPGGKDVPPAEPVEAQPAAPAPSPPKRARTSSRRGPSPG